MELSLLSVFGAGLLTLVTPCILPMLPVYLTLLLGAGLEQASGSGRRRLLLSAALFVAGFSLVFTLLGMVASSIGGVLQAHRPTLLLVGGVLIALFGLKYLGVLRLPGLDRTLQLNGGSRPAGALSAFVFGIVFALGWTPCVGPILGSVLTYTAATTSSAAIGALYLLTYSLGIGIPLLIVSLAADSLLPKLKKLHQHLPKLEKVTGAAMLLVGAALVYPAFASPEDPHSLEVDGTQHPAFSPPIGAPTERPRIVKFYSKSCPVCERMEPRLAQLRQDCMAHRVEILEVDVNKHRELAHRYGVTGVPVIQLFDANGQAKQQLYGERDLQALRAAAASLTSAPCAGQRAPSRFEAPSNAASCSNVAGSDADELDAEDSENASATATQCGGVPSESPANTAVR